MSEFVKGKVTNIGARETSIGTMYDIEVAGQRYGAGKYEPKVKAGQYVKFEVRMNGKYANVQGRVSVISADEAGPEQTPRSGGSSMAPASSYAANDEKRQQIISRQAARNTAVAFMGILQSADALAIPASAKSPAQRAEVLTKYLDAMTDNFNSYALGAKPGAEAEDESEEDEANEDFN